MSERAFPSRAEIESEQHAKLRSLLAAIVPANPFQAKRLQPAGVDSEIASLDAFTAAAPFTTKSELARDQSAHPPYGTNLTYPLERYTRLHQTSSTTGSPLRWLDTTESWNWMLDAWEQVLRAAGVSAADRVFFAFSFGPFIGFWMAFDAAMRMGCLAVPGGGMNSVTRLRAILANEITVLCCTPTYALRLGDVADEEGIDLARSSVRTIIVGGEPGASIPATRARIEKRWPTADLHDHHGMTEVGPVTHQCPVRRGVLHVMESHYLAEVVDPESGESIAPGQDATGELVLTTLGRTGSPLLRYRTGDLVRALPPSTCACGRNTLALEGGIIGRVDDMVVVRGVNLFPSAIDQIIGGYEGIAEYRMEIDTSSSLAQLHLKVEPSARCGNPEALCDRLEKAFRDAYNLRIPVTAVGPNELPRFELKARRWVKTQSTSRTNDDRKE